MRFEGNEGMRVLGYEGIRVCEGMRVMRVLQVFEGFEGKFSNF